ncbi:FRG domain-containing protein [Aliivibrio fischeri]|uniref:FRG domain-containing protein n=1 Tax=Aliivibrio fischeri TaxID=668 RepID=UPI001328E4FD|nr:FRG domain-containing protein [Aliivibrio fischeri]
MKKYTAKSVAEYVALIEDLYKGHIIWFRGVADTKFKPVPGVIWQNAFNVEGALEHDFLVSYKSYVAQHELNSWEIYALMQHHGLPTRLLDWSESALVALYFALTSNPDSTEIRGVWALRPAELNKLSTGKREIYCPAAIKAAEFEVNEGIMINFNKYLPPNLTPNDDDLYYPELPLAIYASKHIKRIASQKGCFTVHGADNRSIDQFLDNEYCQLIEIEIASNEERLKMISTLDSLGIDEEFIYQDLDSLCDRLKRRWLK